MREFRDTLYIKGDSKFIVKPLGHRKIIFCIERYGRKYRVDLQTPGDQFNPFIKFQFFLFIPENPYIIRFFI